MDSGLSVLTNCRHLALSTNSIAAISNLAGLSALKILSLGRNQIKKIENLEAVADNLEELWLSYNLVEKLNGLDKLQELKVLYMSNNKIGSWSEIEKLKQNPNLVDVLFLGNPFCEEYKDDRAPYRIQVSFFSPFFFEVRVTTDLWCSRHPFCSFSCLRFCPGLRGLMAFLSTWMKGRPPQLMETDFESTFELWTPRLVQRKRAQAYKLVEAYTQKKV